MSVVETFGDRLKDLMELEGYNNKTLGAAIGVNRKTVGRWLLERHYPNYIALIKLARHFRVSTDYLLGESGYAQIAFPKECDFAQIKVCFAEKVNSFLNREKLSENAFCKVLGLEHSSVSKWIKGGCMPEAQTLVKLSRAMGISIDSLLGIE